MDDSFSEGWVRMMNMQKSFMRAAMEYRETVTEKELKMDLMTSFDDRIGAMSTIRLIKDGYISIESMPTIWYRLIAMIFETEPSVAKWIAEILLSMSEKSKNELKKDAVRLVDFYSSKEPNELPMLICLQLLISLECNNEEVEGYIKKHNSVLGL